MKDGLSLKHYLGKVPLERALSKLGIASRTQARKLILEGRVRVHGVLKKNPLYLVTPEKSKIIVDDLAVKKAKPIAMMFHKPKGLVTTRSDEKGRATIFSLIEHEGHLSAVGRLDMATTGLLILTNDTRFSNWLTDPKNEIPRIYLVSVRGEMTEEKIKKLEVGITEKEERLFANRVQIRKTSKRESHLTVELSEGKNREIRRMFLALGHEVTKLKRISFGGLELGELEVGTSKVLSEKQLKKAFPKYSFSGF